MLETILLMKIKFTLGFLRHLLRNVSEITKNNSLKISIGIALVKIVKIYMAIKRCKYNPYSYVESSQKGVL